jgi:hypothetical protein
MMARITTLSFVALSILSAQPVWAQQSSLRRGDDNAAGQEVAASNGVPNENSPMAEKRAWVLDQMLIEFANVDRRVEIEGKVAQMSPQRVDSLMHLYQKRAGLLREEAANETRRQLATSQAYRDMRVQDYQNRLAAARGGRPVGYAPVVTWLPEGASLGASAVVSPDRRYVRMNLQPFFSRVVGVDTFNFRTGRTQPVYGVPYYQTAPSYYPTSSSGRRYQPSTAGRPGRVNPIPAYRRR